MPAVSVIVAAYNAAPYLVRAVESVLAQTMSDLELIVVNDASTDDTASVLAGFKDPRVRVLHNADNRGPSGSRNAAIEVATGTWIAVLDADDWMLPDRLERLMNAADEEGADLVADDHFRILDGSSAPYTTQFRTSRRVVDRRFDVDPVFFVRTTRTGSPSLRLGCSKPLIRKAFLDGAGLRYDEEVWFCEDFQLYLLALLKGARFVVLPEAYYFRRIHKGSITAGDTIRMLQHELALLDKLCQHPSVVANEKTLRALKWHHAEVQSHLAFRKLQREVQSDDPVAVLARLHHEPRSLYFLGRRIVDMATQHVLRARSIIWEGRDVFEIPDTSVMPTKSA